MSTDPIKLSSTEAEWAAQFLQDHFIGASSSAANTIQRLVCGLNDRREAFRRVQSTSCGPFSEQEAVARVYDERHRMEERVDRLRVQALKLAVNACKDFRDEEITAAAQRFHEFLTSGQPELQ